MSDKLKIYACTGLDGTESSTYNYWLDNTKTVSNTQAANKLIALINLKYVQATYHRNLTAVQRAELLDEVDILCVCLYYANEYKLQPELLHHAGEVIGYMVDKGMFKFLSVNSKERDEHLDELLDKMAGLMNEDFTASKDFMQWWKKEVEDSMTVGFSVDEQIKITEALSAAKPVGSADEKTIFDDPDIGKYMSDAGTYFLYTYFTKEQLDKLPQKNRRICQNKAITQNNLKDFCAAVFVKKAYGDKEYLNTLIRTGIIKDFGEEPDAVCEDISNYKKNAPIGVFPVFIIPIIIAALGLLGEIIKAICDAIARVKVAEAQRIDDKAVKQDSPAPEDFDGMTVNGSNSGSQGNKSLLKDSSLLWIGGAALAILMLFRK